MWHRFLGSGAGNDQSTNTRARLIGGMLTMRLYGAIQKVEPQDDGTVRVHGIASSEVVDDQGEIVRADAMRAAIPDYMRFPALREMHQLSAAGTTLEAEVGDDGATRIVAHVVDPIAVAKVRSQVYRGFSIGGRVTQREAGNSKAITGLVLNEISLVDRPANPEAIFDCWKAATGIPRQGAGDAALMIASPTPEREPFNPPIQIWACGMPDHQHRAKHDAVKCLETRALGAPDIRVPSSLQTPAQSPPEGEPEGDSATKIEAAIEAARRAIETAEGALTNAEGRKSDDRPDGSSEPRSGVDYADPGYQSDGRPRYPIDTERHIRAAWNYINRPSNAQRYTTDQVARIRAAIIAAWKEKIDIEGPPSAGDDEKASSAALATALCDVGHVAQIILELEWLQAAFQDEAAIEGNNSTRASRVWAIIAELRDLLNALMADKTGELLGDGQIADESLARLASELIGMTAGGPVAARIGALLSLGNSNMQKLAAALLAKAKHSQGDQALADIALYACDTCLKIDGLSVLEKGHLASARDSLCEAGAAPPVTSTIDMAEITAPQMDLRSGDFCTDEIGTPDGSRRSGAMPLGKRAQMHQDLIDIAHDCVSKLTGGTACSQPSPSFESVPQGNATSKPVVKGAARHSAETMGHLRAAHDQLVAAGAKCDAAGIAEEQHQGTDFGSVKASVATDLAKVLADERAEKTALVKALGEMVPLLDRLSKRVDDIARTPLPPLTIARGSVSVSKQQDGGSTGSVGDSPLSPETIASALAKMSKEEQTLTLIKASYANPIPVLGVPPGER
jgi:uncharacterized protein DUF6582